MVGQFGRWLGDSYTGIKAQSGVFDQILFDMERAHLSPDDLFTKLGSLPLELIVATNFVHDETDKNSRKLVKEKQQAEKIVSAVLEFTGTQVTAIGSDVHEFSHDGYTTRHYRTSDKLIHNAVKDAGIPYRQTHISAGEHKATPDHQETYISEVSHHIAVVGTLYADSLYIPAGYKELVDGAAFHFDKTAGDWHKIAANIDNVKPIS